MSDDDCVTVAVMMRRVHLCVCSAPSAVRVLTLRGGRAGVGAARYADATSDGVLVPEQTGPTRTRRRHPFAQRALVTLVVTRTVTFVLHVTEVAVHKLAAVARL